MSFPIITHGSENSLDHDVYIVIPEKLDGKEAKSLCKEFAPMNANLIVVQDNVVVWCYKGTVDECNNSIISTYRLHEQEFDIPVEHKLPREYGMKMLRTIRGILSHCSRTQYRKEVKKALRSSDIQFKIEVLRNIDLSAITDFEKNSITEVYKFLAFQLGQTLSLLEDDKELFTKNSVSSQFTDLSAALQRLPSDVGILQEYLVRFIDLVADSVKEVKKQPQLVRTDFFGKKEIMKTKEEVLLPPVVVFDLDNTLYDETHRAEYRINQDHDTYFSLCEKDTPIQNVVNILLDYYNKGYEIWLASGRYEPLSMEGTLNALKRDKIPFHGIKLRGKGNYVPDFVLKPAWMAKYIGLDRIEAVYDDQERVIEGFRKKGLTVFDATKFH
jgi:hypothetical protein